MISGAYALHDWFKENAYYFLGNIQINRIVATLVASFVATAASMPFDTLRLRLYTQRPLPNGKWPYEGTLDCVSKIFKYEGNVKNNGNLQAFYAGFLPCYLRFFAIALVSQYALDFYKNNNFVSELWTPATYSRTPHIKMNMHEPFTLAFHKGAVQNATIDVEETSGFTPDMKPLNVL